jgi:hypothetical protein
MVAFNCVKSSVRGFPTYNAYQPNTKIEQKQRVAVQDESITFIGVLCNYVGKPLTEDLTQLKATITNPKGEKQNIGLG